MGAKPIHFAFLCRRNEIGKQLVQQFPRIVAHTYGPGPYFGENILHIAIIHQDFELVDWLLDIEPQLLNAEATGSFFDPAGAYLCAPHDLTTLWQSRPTLRVFFLPLSVHAFSPHPWARSCEPRLICRHLGEARVIECLACTRHGADVLTTLVWVLAENDGSCLQDRKTPEKN